MTDRFPRACFAARPILKSILAELLPETPPSRRLEIFAREAGHRSDAAFEACQLAEPGEETFSELLAQAATAGHLLPLLAAAAAPEALPATNGRATARPSAPQASQMLKLAYAQLDAATFAAHLDDPVQAIRGIEALPARWLFAVAVRDARLPTPKFGDKFWVSKAQGIIVPLLFLMREVESDALIDCDLIPRLREVSSMGRDPWTRQSHELIRQFAHMPEMTMGSVLTLVSQVLGQRRSWWVEPASHDVGIGPGAM